MDTKQLSKGLVALTVGAEQTEVTAALNGRIQPMPKLKLQYIGRMKWADEMGIDSRMWNVLSPHLEGYPTGKLAGVPTLTIDGLKANKLI